MSNQTEPTSAQPENVAVLKADITAILERDENPSGVPEVREFVAYVAPMDEYPRSMVLANTDTFRLLRQALDEIDSLQAANVALTARNRQLMAALTDIEAVTREEMPQMKLGDEWFVEILLLWATGAIARDVLAKLTPAK